MSDDNPKDWDKLTPAQKYRVDRYIQTLLAEQPPLPLLLAGRQVAGEIITQGNISYRPERIKCGKKNCKCAAGELHGPYWYAYWREGGKVKSRYIGKQLKPVAPPATGTNDHLPHL